MTGARAIHSRVGDPRIDDETVIRMRIHGITPAFIRRVEARRTGKPSGEELIQLRLQNKS